MKYYNNNGKIQAFFTEGAVEITNPVRDDGTLLPSHDNAPEDTSATYYNQDGTIDIAKELEASTDALIAHFKSLYLKVISDKLEVLKYDSLTTVKIWIDDAEFGTEATSILAWYKNIINKNILIEDTVKAGTKFNTAWAGVIPTDDEYLAEINAIEF